MDSGTVSEKNSIAHVWIFRFLEEVFLTVFVIKGLI